MVRFVHRIFVKSVSIQVETHNPFVLAVIPLPPLLAVHLISPFTNLISFIFEACSCCTQGSMYHCLRVAEIMSMVMDFMMAGSHRNSREVLSLMKTCKMFYEPCLNILWQDLDYLAPLIMCLPAEDWIVKNGLLVSRAPNSHLWL